MNLGGDTKVVLSAKYRQMLCSQEGLAHPYTDTAHRAALMYAFATALTGVFVQFSGWSAAVDLAAAAALLIFFIAAIAGYMVQGLRGVTDNQVRDRVAGLHGFMAALIAAEIGGLVVLLTGFADGQIL